MHPNPRRILPVVAVVVIGALVWWFVINRPAAADTGALSASGTIEAVSITIAPEIAGRVVEVLVSEGQTVAAGDVLVPTFFALLAPAGTPPAIVARLNAEMKKALADPAIAERLTAAGLVVNGSSPEVMANTVRQDNARFGALVKAIGIKPE